MAGYLLMCQALMPHKQQWETRRALKLLREQEVETAAVAAARLFARP